jgi:hypothetical protein
VRAVTASGESNEIGQIELVISTDTRTLKALGSGVFEAEDSAAFERAVGVGKTTLLGALLRHAKADHCVICLIGERGREADELWYEILPPELRSRSTMVLATSDQPAALRARAMWTALAHAESLSM